MAISGKKTDKHFKQSSSGYGERFPSPAIQDNFGHYKATGGETEISASDFQGNVSWDTKSWEQITLISSVGGMLMPNSSTLGENDFDASTSGTIKFGTALQANEIIFFRGHKIWHNGVQVVNQSFKRKDFTVPAGSTQQTFELPFQLPLSYFNGAERSPVYLLFVEGFSRPLERKANNLEANSGDYVEVAISGTDRFNKIKLDSAIGDPSVDTHLTVWVGGSYNSGDLDSAQIVQNAENTKIRWQKKELTTSITSDQTMTELSYSLDAGKTYFIMWNFNIGNSDGDASTEVQIKDGATTIAKCRNGMNSADGDSLMITGSGIIHTMSDGALTFDAASISDTSQITADSSYVVVAELRNAEETILG